MIIASIHCRQLIGRRRELEFLVHRRRDLGKGHGGIVLVRGDAGIGKSRLVREFLDASGRARGRVAIGRCRPFTSRPYEALDEILEAFRSGATPLLPAASKDEQRSRIVDALLACAGRHACVVIIEDLHWADRETIAVIALLAEQVATKRLLVVATYRSYDVHDEHPLYGELAALQRSAAVRELQLEPLSRQEATALIAGALEDASVLSADSRRAIVSVAEGNPFFIEELLRSALERGKGHDVSPAWPTTVRAAIGERIALLDGADRAILAHAAILGRYFDVDLLAEAIGADVATVVSSLTRACALQIVEETSVPSMFSFRHAITREVMFDNQLAVQRRPLHRRIAAAIEARGVDDRTVGALAYHWWAAGDGAAALLFGERAGDHAQSVHDYESAVANYGRTLSLLGHSGSDALRITTKIASSFFRAGAMEKAAAWYRTAWESLDESAPDSAFVFRLARDLAGALYNDGRPHEALEFWREAIDTLVAMGDASIADVARATFATFLADAGRTEETAAVLDAIAPASIESEPRTALAFLSATCVVSAQRGDVERLRSAAAQLCELGERLATTVLSSNHIGEAGMVALYCGETAVACRCVQLALDNAVAFNASPVARGDLLLARAVIHEACGEYRAAHLVLERARTSLADMKLDQFFFAQLALAIGLASNDPELLAFAPDDRLLDDAFATGTAPIFGPLAAFHARFLASRGATEEARRVALRAVAAAHAANESFGAFPLAIAAAALCARSQAADVRRLCARDVGRGPAPAATSMLVEAMLEIRFGAGEAVATARRAAEAFASVGWPLYEAMALQLAGESVAAAAIRERIGYVGGPLLGAVSPERGGGVGAADRFGAGLTLREREIARLVAGGRSNRETALELGVSVKLIEKHLSSVFRKLGVRTRTQLTARIAASAHERGVVL